MCIFIPVTHDVFTVLVNKQNKPILTKDIFVIHQGFHPIYLPKQKIL